MKIVIHGTKLGHDTFTPEDVKMIDARPDKNKIAAIGQQAYSIYFNESSVIFSKYKIIRDVLGDKRTGNVAFSLLIPHAKKLSGIDILTILNKVSSIFCSKHIVNDNLDNFKEDWVWVSEINNEYESKLKFNDDHLVAGNADPAFIYYDSDELLAKYFDLPYQEEYSAYKQIFFVEKTLEGKPENPLNALRHDPAANLTGKIDLENPKYKLIYNQHATGGVNIEVKVDRPLQYSKNKIRKNDKLEIIWSKQYHKKIYKTGTWDDIGSDFLDINNDKEVITVKDKELDPIKYTLRFQTNPKLDEDIIKIKIGNNPEQTIKGHSFTITEEQLCSKCYVSVKNDLYILPTRREIKREDTNVDVITLDLSKYKKVKFIVKGENGVVVKDCSISIFKKEVNKDNEVLFIGDDEIEKTWEISVSHRDYETKPFKYCPDTHKNPYDVIVKKRTLDNYGQDYRQKRYRIIIDEEKGNRNYKKGSSTIPDYEFNKPEYECDAKYGYKFIKWEKVKPLSSNDTETYEAIFKELWYRKIPKLAWIFMIVVFMASTVSFIVYLTGKRSDPTSLETLANTQVNSYIEGIELNLDTLKEYKRKYCDSTSIIQSNVKEKSFWQKIWIFGSDDNSNSTNGPSVIPDFCSKIDNAIAIRTAINLGKIDDLKGKVFSESQQNFKSSIDNIEDKYKKQIGDTLNVLKVSILNLNQVAELILKTQSDLREKETVIQKETVPVKNTNQDKQNEQKIKDQQKNNTQNQQNSQTQKQQSNSNSLKKEFWDLVHSGNDQMESYLNLLKKHKNKGGDIIAYLNKICENSASFKKFKDIPEMDRKSAKTLTEIDIN